MKTHLKNVNHDYIRYANCWEDADLLLSGLEIEEGDKVLSIGSAGDNSFSLLVGNPEMVVAVDINPVQLKLIELKKAAIQSLSHKEFLQFLGFRDCENRLDLFRRLSLNLSNEARVFWAERFDEIENGIIYQGKFENYFGLFQKKILPFIHSKKDIDQLLEPKTAVAQKKFFSKTWNSFRWRGLFKVFFSRFVMGKFGRDPKFLEEVKVSVPNFILDKAKLHLETENCQSNYFLDFILRGKFNVALPHYARKENFNLIKNNVDKLVVFEGYASDAFQKFESFNKFNLSNIFEYMNVETFKEISSQFIANGIGGAKYAYWNLMVPRDMANMNTELQTIALNAYNDNGFFYSKFHVNQKK